MNDSIITKEIEIDMGHRIPVHKSKCKNLHGHRFRVEVGVSGKIIDKKGNNDEGMIIDFGELKKIMLEEIDYKYDHSFMMYKEDELANIFKDLKEKHAQNIIFVDFIPSVENLSKHFYELLKLRLDKVGIKLSYIRVWETPTCSAIYKE